MNLAAQKIAIRNKISPIVTELDKRYLVATDVAPKVIDHLVKQYAKHQDWSNARLVEHVALQFKLKKR